MNQYCVFYLVFATFYWQSEDILAGSHNFKGLLKGVEMILRLGLGQGYGIHWDG